MATDSPGPDGSTMLVLHGSVADLRRALASGLSVDDDQTPRGPLLLWAAEWGRADLIEVLLEGGARPDPLALVLAASKGHEAAARLLLDAGWAPGEAAGGWTPLHAAADRGKVRVVEMLIGAGADPSPLTDTPSHPQWHGKTAAELARQRGGKHADAIVGLLDGPSR